MAVVHIAGNMILCAALADVAASEMFTCDDDPVYLPWSLADVSGGSG